MTLCFLLLIGQFLQPGAIYVRLGCALPAKATAAERASLQGLQLLSARLNQFTPFYGPSQLPLRLRLTVEDAGEADRAAEIYDRFIQNQEVDFLVGMSAQGRKAAVETGTASGVLTLLTGVESWGRHLEPLSPWAFTPDVQVQDIMAGVIELASKQSIPATSVATIWDAGSSFAEHLCAGASFHAQRLGMRVLDTTGIADQAMMPHMRHLKALGPDLLLGCGNLRGAEQILISANSLSFIPLGIVLTALSSRDAVRSIGAHLANYVMSPTAWEPSSSLTCPVFGSAKDFANAYRAKFNEEPRPESAAAAAGGIALLAAIQQAGSLDQEAVREALLTLDLQTCYGRLAFSANGTRQHPVTGTRQVQPYGQDQSLMERWTSADIVALSGNPTGWPLPTWVQKEIDIYPCRPGEAVVLDTAGNASTCKQCPVGQYRTPRSVECEDCHPGTYGSQPGMSRCNVCPSGAECPGNAEIFAQPGFYCLPSASQSGSFAECARELCLGGNQCKENHQGILCRSCEPGYSLPLWGLERDFCSKCPSDRVALGGMALTISLYVFYIWLIVKGTLSASQSVKAIHSVILKIGVNYLQFAGTAFEATEFKEMMLTIYGPSVSWLTPFVALPQRLQYPFTALMSLDCFFPAGSSIRPYQVEIIIGLSLMPAAFFIMTLFAAIRKDCCGVLLPWLRRRWERRKAMRAKMDEDLESSPKDLDILGARQCPMPSSPSSVTSRVIREASPGVSPQRRSPGVSPQRRGGGDFTPMSAYGLSSPWHQRYRTEEDSVAGDRPHPLHAHTKVFVNNVATRFINSTIVMSFILHPIVVRILVVGFECEELDTLRHRHDLSVECKSGTHMMWLVFSTAGLVIYGLGVPVSLFIALCRVRKQLFRSEVRKRFGFLYNGFELKYYYFESVYMFRKVMILLFFTAPTMYVRMVLMLFTSFGFILLHVYSGPFDNRSYLCLDRLEAMNLFALTATVSARLIFDLRKELSGEFFEEVVNHWTMNFALVAGPLLAHAAFVWFAMWCLFRQTVLKHLLLKADIWPERLTTLQKCLLAFEFHKQKALFDEDERGLWIDTSMLRKEEKDYVFVAMCDTLHRYMDAHHRVYPADMAAAVQEALVRCRRARRKRAVRLEQLEREHREHKAMGRKGCLSRIIRWQRLMSVSVYGADRQEPRRGRSCFERLLTCVRGPEQRCRGLPQKALHMELEQTQEFLAEEFFDALIPVWQEITEGRGPEASPKAPRESTCATSVVQIMPRLLARLEDEIEEEKEGEEKDDDGERSEMAEERGGGSLNGSSLRLEALLGRQQPVEVSKCESGGLEHLLQRARSGCRIDLPDLIEAHDALMAENLELRKENEALRSRASNSPKKLRSEFASPKSCTQASPSRFSRAASEEKSEKSESLQIEVIDAESEVPQEETPSTKSQTRSSWRAQATPKSPSIMNAAAAAFAAAISPMRQPRSPKAEKAEPTLPEAAPAPAISVQDAPKAANQLSPASCTARPSGTYLRLPVPSVMERSREMQARSPGTRSGGSRSPWRNAMRPVQGRAWSDAEDAHMSAQRVPFEFMGAARPTDPSAWPQVE